MFCIYFKKKIFKSSFLSIILKIVFLSYILNISIYSQSLSFKNISIYENETSSFSKPKNLFIKKGILESIEISKSTLPEYFAIPTFCDLDSTITSDSLGGLGSTLDIDTSLKSYLAHGVSHVLLVNNPKWLSKYLSDKKIKYPYLYFTDRSIINKSSEYSLLPEDVYLQVENFQDAKKEIHRQIDKKEKVIFLLNRFYKDSEFNFQEEYFRDLAKIETLNSTLIVSNFGEPQAILDSIRSEIRYLKDPIPLFILEKISTSVLNKINYIPELNVYYNLMISEEKQELQNELEFLSNSFPFFKKYYYKSTQNFIENRAFNKIRFLQIEMEYKSYENGINKYLKSFNKTIASGGAGHLLSFPGISLLRETKLISDAGGESRINIDYLLNACNLIDTDYKGKIKIGEKANIIFYKKDPLESLSHLTKIDKLLIDGTLVKRPE